MASLSRLCRGLAPLAAALLVSGAIALPAVAQRFPLQPHPAPRLTPRRPIPAPFGAGPRRAALATVTEPEPNDSLASADAVSLGDTVSGAINPSGDVDWFAITLTAGTSLDLDVDASQIGSPLDAVMALLAADTTELAYSDDADGPDPHIRYAITKTGTYWIGVAGYTGGPQYTYLLKIGTVAPGPGDPTSLFASGLGYPVGLAADASGNLFTVDENTDRIMRVAPNGSVSAFATVGSVGYPPEVVVDGFGDLLTTGWDNWGAAILRVSARDGSVAHFASVNGSVTALTVGADGDVWAATSSTILRFDPVGALKDSVNVGVAVRDLAFSPAGELHFTNGYDTVYKLTGTTVVTVITAAPYVETLAFDRDGYLYVANGYLGEIALYDPSYHAVGSAFAWSNLGGPLSLAFGRAADGSMTSRLFVANAGYNLSPPWAGSIVEMNPAGMRAPGMRIGADLLRLAAAPLNGGVIGEEYLDTLRMADAPSAQVRWSISHGQLPRGLTLAASTGIISGVPEDSGWTTLSVRADVGTRFGMGSYTIIVDKPTVSTADAINDLLGAGVLTAARERFLDLQGNHNGHFDVGDLRAFLRVNGLLPGAVDRAAPREKEEKP